MKNKLSFFLIILVVLFTNSRIYSQNINTQMNTEVEYNRNAIYLELFGNGLFYSVNYERLFKENLSIRFGGAYFSEISSGFISFGPHVTLPILINYHLSINENKIFEIGLGTTLVFLNTDSNIYLTSSIGLKSLDQKAGKFFKINLSPYIENINKGLNISMGLSIGKNF